MMPARAQQVVANGTTRTASGTIDTGTAGSQTGYALHGLNNGIILGNGPLTLITGGGAAHGANAVSGGKITIAGGSTVTTTGLGAIGLYATGIGTDGTPSTITATNTAISTAANNLYSVYATQSGVINLTGGSVTAGSGSQGLFAYLGNATINASGVAVFTNGANGIGVQASQAGVVNLTVGSIATTGSNGYGLYTIGAGAALSANGTTIQTTGNEAIGAYTMNGRITLQNVALTTNGAYADGARVDNASTLTITDGSITTKGLSAYGLLGTAGSTLTSTNVIVSTNNSSSGATAQFGAQVTMNGGSVTTTGDLAHGLFSVGRRGMTGASLMVNDVSVRTSGINSQGAWVRGGSNLTIASGSRITTTGLGAAALFASAYDANPSTVTVTHSMLESMRDAGIRTNGTTLNASFTGSSLSGGAALTDISSGSTSNVTLQNNSLWTVTGNSNLTSLTNGGTVSAVDNAPGTTLTVTGPYVGHNGILKLSTALGGNDSASDRLILSGPTAVASGNTSVQITNINGLGGLTTGNGIELISAIGGATTSAQTTRDAFALAEGHIEAGAYEYRLYAADANGAGENWYLRSSGAPIVPPGSTPDMVPPVEIPAYRAEVSLLAVLPSQLRQADIAMLSNLHKRMGGNDLRSQYFGMYGAYANDTGFYVDGVLQTARHRYTASPPRAPSFKGKGDSRLASVEVGQSFSLAPGWKIEPQLQLVHHNLSIGDQTIFGARVQQNVDSDWLVRTGVRVKGEVKTAAGILLPYARFNVYHSLGGKNVARFSGPAAATDIVTHTGGTSTELAAGGTLRLSRTTSLYGELGSLFASGGSERIKDGLHGSAGLRVRW